MICAIYLAGGKGERIKSTGIPKQFYKIGDKPLIAFALEELSECAAIDAICIVSFEEKYDEIRSLAEELGVKQKLVFADAGKTRQHSVLNGLNVLDDNFSDEISLVIIHDAARPLVKTVDFEDCINAANGFDGATPSFTPSDTIYLSDNYKTITALLERDKLFAGQTPECYNFAKYLAAMRKLSDSEIETIRGSSEIAFLSGMNIHLFPGNPFNIKITTERDLEFLKFLIEKESKL
jgi:2-C-methyl-D-erythritol 4-phosphate cytidylyltransferase